MTHLGLKLPPPGQIGILVRDLDATRTRYETVYGIGPWITHEHVPELAIERAGPVDVTLKIATAYSGAMQIELIQLVRGRCFYCDTLDEREGLHHLGFMVNDLEARLEQCKALGIGVIQRGRLRHKAIVVDYAYLDTTATGGIIFELLQTKVGPIPVKMNRLNHRISAWLGV